VSPRRGSTAKSKTADCCERRDRNCRYSPAEMDAYRFLAENRER
jgi:hypothetical protein